MQQIELDFYQYMIKNSSEIAKQLEIANKLKRFELELALKAKYNVYDSRFKDALKELNECMD